MPLLWPVFSGSLLKRTESVASCGLFTSSYVGSLYLFRATRVSHKQGIGRNHPDVIRARMYSVGLSTILSVSGVWMLLCNKNQFSSLSIVKQLRKTLRLLGMEIPSSLTALLKLLVIPASITATLFTGPLYSAYLDERLPGQANFSFQTDIKDTLSSLQGIRDYIVGPLTEEVVFRSCVATISRLGGETFNQTVFISPMYFGIAHIHHVWEVYSTGGKSRESLKRGILQSVVQFGYTTLFGWYSTFIFLQTGSIIPPLVSHIFCNIMGLPQPTSSIKDHPDHKLHIYISYMSGIVGFAAALWKWTDPALYDHVVI